MNRFCSTVPGGHADTNAGSQKSDGSIFSERRGVLGYERRWLSVSRDTRRRWWLSDSGVRLGQPGLSGTGHTATRAHANVPN